MIAQDVIHKIRQRLRDNSSSPKYSDDMIIGEIATIQNDIIREFKKNIYVKKKELQNGEDSIIFPHIVLKVHSAKVNDIELEVKGVASITTKNRSLISSNLQRFTLHPKADDGDEIEMIVSCASPIEDIDTTLALEDIFIDALVYGSLRNLFQIEYNEQNFQRIQLYENLFLKELNKLRAYHSNIHNSQIRTRFIKI